MRNTNNIISHLYGNATKAFRKFTLEYPANIKSNITITDDGKYIVFCDVKGIIPVKFLKEYKDRLTLDRLYKYSVDKQILNNLIALYKFKFENGNHITVSNSEYIYNIISTYKERHRTITYPANDSFFTHLVTITYSNLLTTSIFRIIQRNKEIIKKVNQAIRRIRAYIQKWIKNRLKKIIKDKKKLNETVRKYTNKIFGYFKVYELHESNHIHVHFLMKLPKFIRNMPFKIIIKKFATWFETAENGVDIKFLKKGKRYAQRYVTKYLNKQFTNDNMFYVINEYGEIFNFIKLSALIRNDIKRMTSRSRNIKVKKYKPLVHFEKVKNESKEKIAEFRIVKLEIIQKNYKEFKEIIAKFEEFKKQKERNRIKWKEPEEIDWVDF